MQLRNRKTTSKSLLLNRRFVNILLARAVEGNRRVSFLKIDSGGDRSDRVGVVACSVAFFFLVHRLVVNLILADRLDERTHRMPKLICAVSLDEPRARLLHRG